MKKLLVMPIFTLLLILLSGCANQVIESGDKSTSNNQAAKPVVASQDKKNNEYPMSSAETVADKLEVFYFHSTARCYSCKTIGAYVKDTMEQKYAKQLAEGMIDYREINVDLPENEDLARKFQATGSSLYINRIIDGQDNIEPDTNVWKLLGDETKFKSYLENKINAYLNI